MDQKTGGSPARYLNVGIGRFYGRDPFHGTLTNPLSLTKHLYANADPVNTVDPSGLLSLVEVAITVGIIGVLAAVFDLIPTRYVEDARVAASGFYYDGLKRFNTLERILYQNDPSVGRQVLIDGGAATFSASIRYDGDSQYLGNGDAFRHALWNALMTRSVGVDWATRWGDAHEAYQHSIDSDMDRYNNNIGRVIGLSSLTDVGAELHVKMFVDSGRMLRVVGGLLVPTNTDGNLW